MNTLLSHKDWFLSLLHWIPFRQIAADLLMGFLFSLLAGVGLVVLLQQYGLLTRRNRFYNTVVKIFWFYIPLVFVISGLQIAATRTIHHAANNIIEQYRITAHNFSRQFLDRLQTELDTLIKQDSNLQQLSINQLLDQALAQVSIPQLFKPPSAVQTCVENFLTSDFVKNQLKKRLTTKASDLTGLDENSLRLLCDKSLQEMVETDFLIDTAQQQLRLLAISLYQGAVLQLLIMLIPPGLEIAVARWRKW